MARPAPDAAIVTGAGSGIGRATAIRLAALGHPVVLAGRCAERLEATGAMLDAPWVARATDITHPDDVEALAGAAVERFERIGVLVNSAGSIAAGRIEQLSARSIRRDFMVNAVGAAWLIRAIWPHLLEQRAGVIVNISSLASRNAARSPFAYAASKSALDSMTRCCAAEGAAAGITAYSINPGFVETAMLRSFADERRVPPSRAISPDAVAAVVERCVTGELAASSGHTMLVGRADAPAWRGLRAKLRERLRRYALDRL